MNDAWYEVVTAATPLTQGDFIFDCPVSTWAEEAKEDETAAEVAGVPVSGALPEILRKRHKIIAEDVIVMTQACDLEHGKVTEVVLCPHYTLSYFRESIWKPDQERKGQKTNSDAWKKYFKGMADGHLWNFCILNSFEIEECPMEHRVVDFHMIYTIPRGFLESLIADRGKPRARLLSPYREHLSQAFARYFMRVGLPAPLSPP